MKRKTIRDFWKTSSVATPSPATSQDSQQQDGNDGESDRTLAAGKTQEPGKNVPSTSRDSTPPEDVPSAASRSTPPEDVPSAAGRSTRPKSVSSTASRSTRPKSVSSTTGRSTRPKSVSSKAGRSTRPKSVSSTASRSNRPKSVSSTASRSTPPEDVPSTASRSTPPEDVPSTASRSTPPEDVPSAAGRSTPPEDVPSTSGPPEKKAKKVRHFSSTWLNHKHYKDWLVYKEVDGVGRMFCKLCIKYKKGSAFANEGSTCFQATTLKDHKKSTAHGAAEKLEKLSKSMCIVKASAKMVSKAEQSVVAAMKNVYFLAKEELATRKHKPLLELEKDIGCEAVSSLSTGGNATYDSNESANGFQDAISATITEDMLNEIRNSTAVSLMIDESTDISVSKNLITFISYIYRGEVKTRFLQLEQIEGSSNAENIYQALLSCLEKHGIPVSKVCGLGTDGAAVMVGRQNGVAALLKRENPHAYTTHCSAHRHALAVSQAAANHPYLRRVQNTVGALHTYFARSAKRSGALKGVQQALEEPVLKMLELHKVRWLSFGNCIENIRRSLKSLFEMLREEAEEDAQADGLFNELRNFKFIYVVYMLEDVFEQLNIMSKIFQTKGLDFSQVDPAVSAAIGSLRDIAAGHHGPSLTKLMEANLADLYPGVEISDNDDQTRAEVQNLTVNFVADVVRNLQDRFPQTELITAFKIMDPSKLPKHDQQARLHDYGTQDLETLLRFYGREDNAEDEEAEDEEDNTPPPLTVDPDAARQEWAIVRQMMFRLRHRDVPIVATHEMWEELEIVHGTELFPNILTLATIARLIPMHTADCERGFSTQNRLKTKLRNRLSVTRLDTLLRIVINGPERRDFDFHRAFQRWAQVRNRRILP
ncbi:zinc finger protein 862-like [Branchiostoma floridae x Branchiostoma japonicum]